MGTTSLLSCTDRQGRWVPGSKKLRATSWCVSCTSRSSERATELILPCSRAAPPLWLLVYTFSAGCGTSKVHATVSLCTSFLQRYIFAAFQRPCVDCLTICTSSSAVVQQ